MTLSTPEGYDRYAKPVLAAKIECAAYHPTQNCDHPRFIRLSVEGADWQCQEVAAALRKLTALPQKTKDASGEVKVPLTWALVTQLSRLAEDHSFTWKPDPDLNAWIYSEFQRRFDEGPGELKFNIASLTRVPMPHQAAGAYVAANNKRFFFGDQAGLGKSMSILLTLAELEARGENPFPAFVVAPASVVDPWLEELEAVFPDWPVTAYRGAKRKNLSSRYRIYVMSWDVFRLDMKHEARELPPLLKFLVPKTFVGDESHRLCNTRTHSSVAARQIARVADYAFLASGTPITRDVGGFWSALNVLDIRSFPDQDRYKDRYTDRWRSEYGQDEISGLSPETKKEFYNLIQGSMRYVAKADVLKNLPPKTYSTRIVQIPPAHRTPYDEMAKDMIAHLPDTDEPLEVMSTLAQLQRLTQLASSSCDVQVVMEVDERENSPTFGEEIARYHVTMKEPSWKVTELMNILDEMQGQPLITFSPHTQLMKLAGARAEKEGYRVGYVIGGQSHSIRTATRKAFQAGELDLLCANTSAGGVGLTLTRASVVCFLERPWGFWQGDQAEDRVHRTGQTEQVHIIDVVAANTVESRVRQALKDKARQLSELVRDKRIVEELLGGQPISV